MGGFCFKMKCIIYSNLVSVSVFLGVVSFFLERGYKRTHKRWNFILLRYKIIHTNEILMHKETKTQ